MITRNVCDTLMHFDFEQGEHVPLLAESYEWADDTTLDITLRSGLTFSDGTALDADDVVYTFQQITDPDYPIELRFSVEWIDSVEKLDDLRVRFQMTGPTPAVFEYLTGLTPIYPSGHYDNAPEIIVAGNKRQDRGAVQPVCIGPYVISEFAPGREVVMERNENYFEGGPKGTPSIGRLVFRTVNDPQAQLAELMTGGIDWIWSLRPDDAEALAQMPGITITQQSTLRIAGIMMDAAGRSGENPFQNILVRQAVNHAIDKEAIAKNLMGEAAIVLNVPCHPSQVGCTNDVDTVYEYDPDKARALLAEAGYADGFSMPIYSYRDRIITEAVIGYLSAIGIDAQLRTLQNAPFQTQLQDGLFTLSHPTWGSAGVNDASASVGNFFTHNPWDYARDDEVKASLEQADMTADRQKRAALYKQALERIAEQAYWAPLHTYVRDYAFTSDLNFTPTPDEMPHFYKASWN